MRPCYLLQSSHHLLPLLLPMSLSRFSMTTDNFFLIQVPQELFLGNLPISEGAPSWGQFSLPPPHGYRLAARHGAAGYTLALVSPVGGFVHLKDCDIRHPGGHMSFSRSWRGQASCPRPSSVGGGKFT